MNGNLPSALALSTAIVISSITGSWAFLHAKRYELTIRVTGSAKKRIKSDLMIWRTSVGAEAQSLAEAYTRLSHDVEKVKTFLTARGVPANQIVIFAVATTPVRRGQKGNDEERTATGPIVAYHLEQSLEIRSSDVDKITTVSRQVTELVGQAILLHSEAPEYLYTRLAETKVAILAAAAQDARARAQQIASSTGSKVGGMRSADMGVLQITPADSNDVSGYGVNDTKSIEKDITAVVHVTFGLD